MFIQSIFLCFKYLLFLYSFFFAESILYENKRQSHYLRRIAKEDGEFSTRSIPTEEVRNWRRIWVFDVSLNEYSL